MAFEVRVPAVGESVQEGEIYKWHKKTGDVVNRDDVLLELETDKATVEIVAEAAGLLEILANEGQTVHVGDMIARIASDGAAASTSAKAPAKSKKEEPKAATIAKAVAPAPAPVPAKSEASLSPAVDRLVKEHGLDPSAITSTGRGGRLTKEDVVNYMDGKGSEAKAAPVAKMPAPSVEAPTPTPTLGGERRERREKMTRLRQRIAERLVEAQHTAAMLTTFNEIDMTNVMEIRKRYKDQFAKDHGINLGFMSFFVKAVVQALRAVPGVNASIDGNEIVYHDYYDVGVAVSTEKGLIVPVVRDCDKLSFAGVEKAIANYAAKGREGKIALEDLAGGTFTVTNGGVFGSLLSTPILNPPQSGILGMHKIEQRPIVIDGQIVARPMMYVALSYDHRIVDGKEAVTFLVKVKEAIEDPARLLLGV